MAQTVELSFEPIRGTREAERRIVFLHGILGSGSNLRTLARRFVAARPGWDAWLVDLRGHGSSPKGAAEPSLAAAAADVLALTAWSTPVAALVGHSFGGKVALAALRAGVGPALVQAPGQPPRLEPLRHVVTLDSNPGTRRPPADGDSAPAILALLESLPPSFASIAAFVDALVARGRSRALAQWLAMSTEPVPGGGVRFALDLREIRALLDSYFAEDLWPVVESPPHGVQVHLLIAEKSSSYAVADRERAHAIAAQNAQISVDELPTDHWMHAEDPSGVLRILLSRIAE